MVTLLKYMILIIVKDGLEEGKITFGAFGCFVGRLEGDGINNGIGYSVIFEIKS